MKTPLLNIATLILFFASLPLQAQYKISTSTQTYQPLQGAIPITGSKYQDTLVVGGRFFNTDTLLLSRNWGYIQIPGKPESTFYFYGTELTGGQWSYKIDTINGIKVLKIEAKNAGFGHDFSQQDYVNVQLWLYENPNTEIHFGLRKINNPDFDFYFGKGGPAIGLKNNMLTGNATAPVLSTADTARITGSPVSGTIYKFTLWPALVEEINAAEVKIYPNPAHDLVEITADFPLKTVTVTDAMGKVFKVLETNNAYLVPIETTFWPTGMYIIRAETTQGITNKKLIKQ